MLQYLADKVQIGRGHGVANDIRALKCDARIVGAKEVRSWGGSVKIVPTVEGFSTTKLIAKAMAPDTVCEPASKN